MIQVESQVFLYLVKEGSKIKEVIIFFKEVAQLISVGHKHIIWLVAGGAHNTNNFSRGSCQVISTHRGNISQETVLIY